jgi:hypothetical protein
MARFHAYSGDRTRFHDRAFDWVHTGEYRLDLLGESFVGD